MSNSNQTQRSQTMSKLVVGTWTGYGTLEDGSYGKVPQWIVHPEDERKGSQSYHPTFRSEKKAEAFAEGSSPEELRGMVLSEEDDNV
jgi:hypothetical protein